VSLPFKDLVNRLRIPAYVVTAYVALGSLLDILLSTWPPLTSDIRWRLTFEGFITTASGSEMLAVLLFLAFAWAAADRIALGVAFAYSVIVAAGYLVCAGVFALDALQFKKQVSPEQLTRYDIGLAWNFGRMVLATLILVLLAVVAFRAFRSLARMAERTVGGPAASLIVGKPQPAAERVKV
jgi:uncharacterized membrane protein